MKYFILAGGSGTRWNHYKGVDKCLLTIDGETLIDRTVRLLEENNIKGEDVVVCGNEEIRDTLFLDEQIHVGADAEFTFLKAGSKREAFQEIAEIAKQPFVALLGDTYYTEAIIKDIVERPVRKWAHWFNPNPNKYTGKPWSEGYCHKVMDWEWWIIQMKDFNARVKAGEIDDGRDYAINGFLEGRPMNMVYFHDFSYISDVDIYWNDQTDDFDFPVDYDRFIENMRRVNPVKLSVVIPFYNAGNLLKNLLAKIAVLKTKSALFSDEIEVIVDDDGSVEDTHWLNKEDIVVVHKPHNNAASARNVGMRAATGQYITFVDADDEILDNFFDAIAKAITNNPTDVMNFRAKCEDGANKHHPYTIWAKVFRTEFARKFQFDEALNSGEDGRFWGEIERDQNHTYKKVDETIYYYHWSANPNSLCKRVNRGELPKEKNV